MTPRRLLALLAAVLLAAPVLTSSATALARPAGGVHVAGNRLLDATGRPVVIAGVSHAGSEYACAQGWGFFDGPVDDRAIGAMTSWGVSAVRLPLNEACWLGLPSVRPEYAGPAYRAAVGGYVRRLEAHGLLVDLDLHWNAPGDAAALGQQVLADADHSPDLWRSVASTYRGDPRVLFELYNEPNGVSWDCWRNGCTTAAGWRAVGMQQLLDAVRSTGARNVVLAGGLEWSNDLSGWLAHRPVDPAGQLAAAFHVYDDNRCASSACWGAALAATAGRVPVVATEVGEKSCSGRFSAGFLRWAAARGIGAVAWTWNTWDCSGGPALLRSYDGTPTRFGAGVRAAFLAARRSAVQGARSGQPRTSSGRGATRGSPASAA